MSTKGYHPVGQMEVRGTPQPLILPFSQTGIGPYMNTMYLPTHPAGRQRTTHVHAGGSHGHGSLNYFTVWNELGLNTRTVPTKVPVVQDILKDHNKLLIPLTETSLRERNEAELQVEGHTLFRQDRQRLNRRRRRDSVGVNPTSVMI